MMKNHTNNNRINSPSQNSGIKPIRHAPNAWSVTQMIDQAPRGMMIRELVKNGIEAAQRSATKGNPGRIVFDSFQDSNASGRVAKLRIFNTGPGMDAAELEKVMDLHSTSGGKANGAGQNFGLGAKLTGLVTIPQACDIDRAREGSCPRRSSARRETTTESDCRRIKAG